MFQFTGITAVVTQANTIVADVIPEIAPYVSVIINAVQLLATVASIAVLSRFGRRPIVLIGNLGLAVIDIMLGIMFILDDW